MLVRQILSELMSTGGQIVLWRLKRVDEEPSSGMIGKCAGWNIRSKLINMEME